MLTFFYSGRVSEVCHLPDYIIIKASNGSLITDKLFGVNYGNGNHLKSAMCLPLPRVPQAGWYEYDGLVGISSKRIRTSIPWNLEKARYSLCPFPIVCPLFASVAAKKKFNKAMVIFRTSKKNTEKKKMEKKLFARRWGWKKMFVETYMF